MAIGGIAELLFGVKAEQKQLEEIAEPLTAEGANPEASASKNGGSGGVKAARRGADERASARGRREHAAAPRPEEEGSVAATGLAPGG